MLDVIKQLMPLKTIQDRPAVDPPGRSGHDNAMFQKLMASSDHPSQAAHSVSHAGKDARSFKADDDRPDLASGWQTADSSAYESAQPAPARPEVQRSKGKSSDDDQQDRGGEDIVSLSGAADQANQAPDSSSSASADSGAQADQSDQAAQAAGQGSAAPSSGTAGSGEVGQAVTQSAVQSGMANMLAMDAAPTAQAQVGAPQAAADADADPAATSTGTSSSTAAGAAPATGGGTPVEASTDASGPAVLSASSDPIVSDGGQSIEMQMTAHPSRAQQKDRPEERPVAPKATAQPAEETDSPTASTSAAKQTTEGQAVMSATVRAAGHAKSADPQTPEKAALTAEPASPAAVAVPVGADLLAGASATDTTQADSGIRPSGGLGVAGGSQGRGPAGTPGAQHAPVLPAADVDHLAARTVRWQRLGMLENQGTARIRLEPPELGSVQVSMKTVDNQVTVQMTVDTESVRQLLQSNSDRLVQSLQAQGLQAARIEVVVQTPAQDSPQQGGQQGGQSNGGQQNPQQHQQSRQQDRPFAQQMREELNLTA